MIASLPMYDLPEMQGATDRYWQAIRDRLRARGMPAPDALTRGEDHEGPWTDPALVLSQACGLPFRTTLQDHVTLVGTPDYGLAGCPPGHYRSLFVARRDDPRRMLADFDGTTLAYNAAQSQSGWAAPMNHAAARGLRFLPGPRTGAHVRSAVAVATGNADLAAIDALSWELMRRWDPVAQGLRVIEATEPTPGTPYITARGRDAGLLFTAIEAAIADLSVEDRSALHLRGLVRIPADAYLAVPNPAAPDAMAAA